MGVLSGTVTMVKYLGDGNPDGVSFGKATTNKLSFYGLTPVVQPSGAAQAAVTTGTPTTLSEVITIQTSIVAFVNKLRTDLVALGLWKGSA